MKNFLWKPSVRTPIMYTAWFTMAVVGLLAVRFCIVSFYVMINP